ncbi:EAL domain protein [Secundilactobacillus oryzae JCM 18671]|uniref:EAL domain protein n=1 Tax=Secundilactobacillus oryzae JCM 18671 TaxID=1291743 RepID=A0A081BG10_9LACO|nr:EAL domain-containing protein [Secundilactobacillus oryzae]GAK46978.1 EAL domain protein [Secundilactobacillus oryzae JCM 18671]
MYQYFVQQIVNKRHQSVIGYELLLKQQTDQGWRLPANFTDIPASIVAGCLIEASKGLSLKANSLSVNLNRQQIVNRQVVDALLEAQKLIRPTRLQIELTEDVSDLQILDKDVISVLKECVSTGITISIDDIDTGCNTEQQVQSFIPFASEIKFALQNFGESVYRPDIQERLVFWRDYARRNKVQFVLEGIEDNHINQLIDTFNIDVRQGYFYEKPHQIMTCDTFQSA